MNDLPSTDQFSPSPMALLREQSASTIQAAIHSPSSAAETLRRTNVCLALYFDPDNDPEIKAAVRESFVRALDHVPTWAMHRAFDKWEKTGQRRPSPGEIVILAERELKPMADELAKRKRHSDAMDAAEDARLASRVSGDAAAEIMARAGFTPKRIEAVRAAPMARSLDEAAEVAKPSPHWSETASADDPRWAVLRDSRAKSLLIQSKT